MSALRFDDLSGRVVELRPGTVRPAGTNIARRMTARLRAWRQRAKGRAELAGLGDRMLADIGITRADAEFLTNKPFWKE